MKNKAAPKGIGREFVDAMKAFNELTGEPQFFVPNDMNCMNCGKDTASTGGLFAEKQLFCNETCLSEFKKKEAEKAVIVSA